MARQSLERSNYTKLLKLVPNILTFREALKLTSPGFMDLNVDLIEAGKDYLIVALSHYFLMNGDMVSDPDMQIRIFPEQRMVEALTYQDQFVYQEVYIREGVYRAGLKLKLDQFLGFWLGNLLAQGHTTQP